MKIYDKESLQLYNCDCLDLLKELNDETINLIYCNIPYNTQLKFNSYNDNLGTPIQAMDYYRPRFKEMKRILKNNGALFIHCNHRLDCYIGVLLDEIFGYKNKRSRIYRKTATIKNTYKNFDSVIDTIFYYVKDINNFVFNQEADVKEYITPIFHIGYNGKPHNDFELNGEKIGLNKINKHLKVSEKELRELIRLNKIVIKDGHPFKKDNAVPIPNLWDDKEFLETYDRYEYSLLFDTPTPQAIIERIIKICSNPGDVVADFFCGSGTTMVACKKLKRKCIASEINQETCQQIVKRLEELIN